MIGNDSNHFMIKEFENFVEYLLFKNYWNVILALNQNNNNNNNIINTSTNNYSTTKPTTTQPAPNKPSTILDKTGLYNNHDLVYFIQMVFASYHHSFQCNE